MDKISKNTQVPQCDKTAISKLVCEHIMCRNPKEHQENKCRLCGKPYKKLFAN
jgi:hypothetical protein